MAASTKNYIDLPPEERAFYEQVFGGRLPVDATVGRDEASGYVMMGMSLNSPKATDEDLLITGETQ